MKELLKKVFLFIWRLPRYFFVALIFVYQKTLSPDHGILKIFFPGGYCRFTPSCSNYSKECFKKYGVFKGLYKSFFRVSRCNPFNKGGIDLP